MRSILPLSWSLSSGLEKDIYWFYHLLTVLPSPYFVGTKDKAVSAQVLVTINFLYFSAYMKYSHVQCGKPHLTKCFFSFLTLISCLNSCKKYLLSKTGLAVHNEDVRFPLSAEVRVISWESSESLHYCPMTLHSKKLRFFLLNLWKTSPGTGAPLSRVG